MKDINQPNSLPSDFFKIMIIAWKNNKLTPQCSFVKKDEIEKFRSSIGYSELIKNQKIFEPVHMSDFVFINSNPTNWKTPLALNPNQQKIEFIQNEFLKVFESYQECFKHIQIYQHFINHTNNKRFKFKGELERNTFSGIQGQMLIDLHSFYETFTSHKERIQIVPLLEENPNLINFLIKKSKGIHLDKVNSNAKRGHTTIPIHSIDQKRRKELIKEHFGKPSSKITKEDILKQISKIKSHLYLNSIRHYFAHFHENKFKIEQRDFEELNLEKVIDGFINSYEEFLKLSMILTGIYQNIKFPLHWFDEKSVKSIVSCLLTTRVPDYSNPTKRRKNYW